MAGIPTKAVPSSETEAPQGTVSLMDRWHKGPVCCPVRRDKEVSVEVGGREGTGGDGRDGEEQLVLSPVTYAVNPVKTGNTTNKPPPPKKGKRSPPEVYVEDLIPPRLPRARLSPMR